MSADMEFKKCVSFNPIKAPKKESLLIGKLRQMCLDLPEDPSGGGYLFEEWTLYQLMTCPSQPYKKLNKVHPEIAC